MNERHITPENDLISHELDPGCVCGPTLEPVMSFQRGSRTVAGWLHIHHSLDGREHKEPRPT